MQLRDWVEETAAGLESRVAASERRVDGCVAHISLVRYDAMNELSGQQSSTRRAARLAPHRRRDVVDPAPRPGALLRQAAARGRLGVRALAGGAGGRGGRALRARPRRVVVRVAYLGPAGTHSEEALRASAPEDAEEVPYPTIYDAVMAVQEGAVDRAVVPIENALEGGVAVTLDTLVLEAPDVRIGGEVVHPIHHCLIAARGARARERRAGRVPPAGHRAVRSLPARAAAGRRARERPLDGRRGGVPADRRRRARPRSGRGSPPSSTAARWSSPDVEDHPDNVTRFVWLAPASEVRRAGRRGEDDDRLLGRRRRGAGLARGRARRARRAARST